MLVNQTTGEVLADQVRLCDTFWRRMRGLMFRRALDPGEVYLFRWGRPSRAEATIHSLFCFFPFAVLWLDEKEQLVDCRRVRPFALVVAPRCAASSFVEGSPDLLDKVSLGDQIAFKSGPKSK
jgi:uncharacterized membrane protein (UPF0127 family)